MKRVCCARLAALCYIISVSFFLANHAAAETAAFQYALIPESPRPGEPVTIAVSAGSDVRTAVLSTGGQRLTRAVFFHVPAGEQQSFMAAVLAVPSTARTGRAQITIEGAAGVAGEIVLNIAERDFASETIELNETLTGIRVDPDPQKTAESERLWAILNRTGADVYSFDNFVPPVASTRRTSLFGNRRVFKYANGSTDTSIHAGVDYGVPTGTPVSVCAPGKVVLARFRIVTGNSVIIEHLPGVYSLYYHLDRIDISEGALVSAGDIMGLSGATGLATGPHLHWEIRVSGENADPDAFITRPILDKDAILSKIGNS